MTDLVHNAPLAIRHFRLPRLTLPKLGIAAFSTSITQAYSMAYVEPFKTRVRPSPVSNDVDLEGRDPNW
mgnify:CR=1 FL=1